MRLDALVPGFEPESPRERALAADPLLRAGLAWGRPRPGHPEGAVGAHVAALLEEIDERGDARADLRFLALVHDAFKFRVRADRPYCPDNDHAVLARRFAERYTRDERLLTALSSTTSRTGSGRPAARTASRPSTRCSSASRTCRSSCASSSSTRRRPARTAACSRGCARPPAARGRSSPAAWPPEPPVGRDRWRPAARPPAVPPWAAACPTARCTCAPPVAT